MKNNIRFNSDIFKEMILYITEKCENKEKFGNTHLNKILYYSDLFWYGEHGVPMSGEEYVKDRYGARAKHVLPVVRELKRDGFLKVKKVSFFDKQQKKPVLLKPVSYRFLNEDQMQHIDKFIDKLGNLTAKELADYAHEDISYKILEKNETIPYESVFFLKPTKLKNLTKEDIEWANSVIDEYEAD